LAASSVYQDTRFMSGWLARWTQGSSEREIRKRIAVGSLLAWGPLLTGVTVITARTVMPGIYSNRMWLLASHAIRTYSYTIFTSLLRKQDFVNAGALVGSRSVRSRPNGQTVVQRYRVLRKHGQGRGWRRANRDRGSATATAMTVPEQEPHTLWSSGSH
jgi:hypothetical protein